MIEGWWCEASRGHFLRGCLNGMGGRVLQELSRWWCCAGPRQLTTVVPWCFGRKPERRAECVRIGGVHTRTPERLRDVFCFFLLISGGDRLGESGDKERSEVNGEPLGINNTHDHASPSWREDGLRFETWRGGFRNKQL